MLTVVLGVKAWTVNTDEIAQNRVTYSAYTGDFAGAYTLVWTPLGTNYYYNYKDYNATLTFRPGKNYVHPYKVSGSYLHIYKGNSLKVTADDADYPNVVRNVRKVEIIFYSDANAVEGDAGISSSVSGELSYDATAKKFTWTGCASSVELFFDKLKAAKAFVTQVNVTIEYLTGDAVISHPVFSPIDQHEFKNNHETVTITCPTEGAEVYYCMNNRAADAEFTKYTGPIEIDTTTFFRAYCMKDGVKGGEDTCKIVSNPNHFVVLEKSDYEKFTYEWTDMAGVTHTSNVTEEATSPEQIMALLYEVYTNKDIPGQIYMNKSEPMSYARYTYDANREYKNGWVGRTANVWNKWWPNYKKYGDKEVGIPVLDEDPIEGYTTLLVKVRPDFNLNQFSLSDTDMTGPYKHGNGSDSTSYSTAVMPGLDDVTYAKNPVYKMISEAYESVQMIFGHRMEDDSKGFGDDDYSYNPGTLYTFDIEAARFFMISKGSACWGARYPLGGMFEELAPHESYHNDVYQTLIDGKVFYGTHVCPSVPYMGHDFTMDDWNHNTYQLSNMTFFIPDYRLKYWEQNFSATRWKSDVKTFSKCRDLSGTQGVNWYHPKFMPETYMYSIWLKVQEGDPVETSARNFAIHPTWKTTLDNVEDTELQQQFVLYRIIEDPVTGKETFEEVVGKDEDPYVTESGIDRLITYALAQQRYGEEVTFVVKGKPVGINIDYVWSNRVTIRVPGYEESEYILLERKAYESRFEVDALENVYCNYPKIVNNSTSKLNANQLKEGDKMRIYRLDALKEVVCKVATIEITGASYDGDTQSTTFGTTTYNYTIAMNEASQKDKSKYPPLSDTFKATGGPYGAIDFGDLYVSDHFSESVGDNAHQRRYHYQLILNEEHIRSNIIDVPVQKTDFVVDDLPYKQEDIDNDIDHSIELTPGVKLNTEVHMNSAVKHYEVKRMDDEHVTVARATYDSASSKYKVENADSDGTLVPGSPVSFTEGKVFEVAPFVDGSVAWGASYHYYPVITATTTGFDGSDFASTYGCDYQAAHLSDVTVTVTNPTKSKYSYESPDVQYYSADITVAAVHPHDGLAPALYRVWRVNPDGSETLLNTLEDQYGEVISDDGKVDWATNYEPLKEDAPHHTITVHDIFKGKPLNKYAGNSFDVTYIARMYSTDRIEMDDDPGDGDEKEGAPKRNAAATPAAAAAPVETTFSIVEANDVVTFNENIPTGFRPTEIPDTVPVGVTYYNLTGVASDQPFEGMNIVVKRYKNGSKTVSKEIR